MPLSQCQRHLSHLALCLHPWQLCVSYPSCRHWCSLLDKYHAGWHSRYHYNWDLPRHAENQKYLPTDSYWCLQLRHHHIKRRCHSKLCHFIGWNLCYFPGFLIFIEWLQCLIHSGDEGLIRLLSGINGSWVFIDLNIFKLLLRFIDPKC